LKSHISWWREDVVCCWQHYHICTVVAQTKNPACINPQY